MVIQFLPPSTAGFARLHPNATPKPSALTDEPHGRWRLQWDVPASNTKVRELLHAGRWGAKLHHLERGWKDSYTLDRFNEGVQKHAARQPWLARPPARVVSVFGPESSGTKLLAGLIAEAGGLFNRSESWQFEKHAVWRSEALEVQHLSLPFGYGCEMGPASPIVWPVVNSSRASDPLQWGELIPIRTFVNITAHLRALRAAGVDAKAIVVMRDSGVVRRSIALRHHCRNESVASAERLLIVRDGPCSAPTPRPAHAHPPALIRASVTS